MTYIKTLVQLGALPCHTITGTVSLNLSEVLSSFECFFAYFSQIIREDINNLTGIYIQCKKKQPYSILFM